MLVSKFSRFLTDILICRDAEIKAVIFQSFQSISIISVIAVFLVSLLVHNVLFYHSYM